MLSFFSAFAKPLSPNNVKCTRTSSGYKISWSYNETPGRPRVQYFLIEYRRLDSPLSWKSLDTLVNSERREWQVDTDSVNPGILYEFRMFSFGGAFSEPSAVAKASMLGMLNNIRIFYTAKPIRTNINLNPFLIFYTMLLDIILRMQIS